MANGWRGCDNVFMRSHGEWSDPDLVIEYNGDTYVFNYWDIESALWDDFLSMNNITEQDTYTGDRYNISPEWEEKFNEYCQENAYDFMLDCIYGEYHSDDDWDPYDAEYTWHYGYRKDSEKKLENELSDLLSSDAYYAFDNLLHYDEIITRKGKNYYMNDDLIGDLDALDDYLCALGDERYTEDEDELW